MYSQYRLALGIVFCLLSVGTSYGMRNGRHARNVEKNCTKSKTRTTSLLTCVVTLKDKNDYESQITYGEKTIEVSSNSNLKTLKDQALRGESFAAEKIQFSFSNKTYFTSHKNGMKTRLSTLMTKNSDTPLLVTIIGTKVTQKTK